MSYGYRPILGLGVALFAISSPVTAQTWSTEQQEVLAVVEQSYVEALGKDATWIDRLTHPEVLSWDADEPVPKDQGERRRWAEYGYQNSTALIHSIQPVGVAIRDNAAVVHYYATVAREYRDQTRETKTSRCTVTLTRGDDTWRYLGWLCLSEPNENP